MYYIDEIERDYAPRREIAERIPGTEELIKMYEPDSAFLCGLLRKTGPKKIVEVGIANGATTAVTMQCLHDMGISASVHGVDILDGTYTGSGLEVGIVAKKAADLLGVEDFNLHLGVCLAEVIEEIGEGIDFLILDTTHKLPGETLDFIAAFPWLSEDATVCLHDVRQNHKKPPRDSRIGTSALFNSVAADKYINADSTRNPDYPNIAAFRLNEDTEKYMTNVFGALTFNWSYVPSEQMMKEYLRIISEKYPDECKWIFERALKMNEISLKHPSMVLRQMPQVFHDRVRTRKKSR